MAMYDREKALNAGMPGPMAPSGAVNPAIEQGKSRTGQFWEDYERVENFNRPFGDPLSEQDLDKYITKGTTFIHSPETRNQILTMLRGKDPVESVARATVFTIKKLDELSRKENIEVNDMVKLKGSEDLIAQIVEVGKAADLFEKFGDDEKELAYSFGIQEYIRGEVDAGRIDSKKLSEEMQMALNGLSDEDRQKLDTQLKHIDDIINDYAKAQQTIADKNLTIEDLL